MCVSVCVCVCGWREGGVGTHIVMAYNVSSVNVYRKVMFVISLIVPIIKLKSIDYCVVSQ